MPRPARSFRMSRFVLVLVGAVAVATPAWAAQRTFVAFTGVDTNPCTRTQPCRSFNAAIALTDPGGEVVILDTAAYGAMTIDRAIKIVGPTGVYGGITAFSGDAITINAAPSDVVVLRGLTMNSLGAANGIHVQSAARVDIEGALISGFWGGGSGAGILVDDAAAPNQVSMQNVTVRTSGDGVRILADAHFRRFDADGLVVTDGNNGLVAQGNLDGTIRNASFAYLGAAVRVMTNAANQHPSVVLERSRIQNSSLGGVILQNTMTNSSCDMTIVDSVFGSSTYHVQMTETGGGFTKLDVARTTFEHGFTRAIDSTTTGSGVTNVMVVDSFISGSDRGVSVNVGPGGYGQLTVTRTAMRNIQNGAGNAVAVYTHANPGGFADAALQNNIFTNTNHGVVADSGSMIRLTGNVIVNSGPGAGLEIQGSGAMESMNNNMVRGSGAPDASPSIVPTK